MRAEGLRGQLSQVSFGAKAEELVDAEKTRSEKGRDIKNSPWGATHLQGTRSMGFSEETKSVLIVTSSPGTEPGPLKHSWSNIAIPMLRRGPAGKVEVWKGQKGVHKTQLGTSSTLPCPSYGKGRSRKLRGRHWGDQRVGVGGDGFGRLGGRGSPAPLIDSSLIMFL